MKDSKASVPDAQPLRWALDQSSALSLLKDRIHLSNLRLDTIRPILPPALRTSVNAGPLDESAWTLLAANAAVAAKLRQCLPKIEHQLSLQKWPTVSIRIHVQASPQGL